jgi:hypothetical protein
MPSRKHKPGKYGTAHAPALQTKNKRQRAYEASLKEALARWLWKAARSRPDSWHSIPLVHIDGAHLLKDAGYIELDVRQGGGQDCACRLTPAFSAWWGGYLAP